MCLEKIALGRGEERVTDVKNYLAGVYPERMKVLV